MRLSILALCVTTIPAHADIVPLDGIWISELVDGRIADACGPEARPMLEPMLQAMNRSQETELDWNGAFEPARAMGQDMSEEVGLTWTRTGDDSWDSTMLMNPGDPRPAMTMSMTAISEARIEVAFTMDMEMMADGEVTDMEGNPIDASGCVLIGTSIMRHTG